VILTCDSSQTITKTLERAKRVSRDVWVVDSNSSDGTAELARAAGASVVQHAFERYDRQRNWAIDNLELRGTWELHLDADEWLSDGLVDAMNDLQRAGFPGEVNGYLLPRLTCFLGRPIRHGGMYPVWHMRLFRRGMGRCESRAYDQHFVVDGLTGRIGEPLIDASSNLPAAHPARTGTHLATGRSG
jgi:glycosyltransferase involved in cell wall biosynthesis